MVASSRVLAVAVVFATLNIPNCSAFSCSSHSSRGLATVASQRLSHAPLLAEPSSPNSEITELETVDLTTKEGVDRIFDAVDVDGSGTIDQEEYNNHLTSAGYSKDAIRNSFNEIDVDRNGEISREEFRQAIDTAQEHDNEEEDEYMPMGYWLNSVRGTCEPLGPLGRVSQKLETLGPFKKAYKRISNLFGVDRKEISKKGVSFVLAYSVISNLNGALSFSVAWYMSIKRTGLSPLVPGQWKTLLSSYAMIYGAIQLLKPFRVAMAIAMSKLSAEYLDMTQSKLNCSRGVAIGCQYLMGQVMMGIAATFGVTVVSVLTGVPFWG